ncbi:MAG: hypothetical protein GY768_18255, partial [Planctomycetaceae bacterium]|nr:hypothetical protein [Planctomycetaceae bacterium]
MMTIIRPKAMIARHLFGSHRCVFGQQIVASVPQKGQRWKSIKRNGVIWLIDSECGQDLLARKDVRRIQASPCAKTPLQFATAGGFVTTGSGASVWLAELQEMAIPYVLDTETPAVLSMGMRCMEMGYSFIWLAGQNPYFINPDWMIVMFE